MRIPSVLTAAALLLTTLAALAPTASAVDTCDTYGICTYISKDPARPCAGAGLGHQGAVGCAEPANRCAIVAFGFHHERVCIEMTAAAPNTCSKYGVCPIVVVEDDRQCVGYAFGLQGVYACNEPDCARVVVGVQGWRHCHHLTLALP